MKYDLILKNGMIIDPVNNMEQAGDLGIVNGYVAEISSQLNLCNAKQVVDVDGKYIIPGLVDSHVHIVRPNSKEAGYRMLVKAGVTTAVDFRGPVSSVIDEIVSYGNGLNVAVLEGIFPGNGIDGQHADRDKINDTVNRSLDHGAIGTKIMGGHFPLTPETTKNIIDITNKERGYVAFHAGTTATGSNILGMEEAIELAEGLPLHLAHINSYCRGLINSPLEEVKHAMELLKKSPNIVSESYLAPFNGTSGELDDGDLPKSHVTRNCLKMFGYSIDKEGIKNALLDKNGAVYTKQGEEYELIWGERAYEIWVGQNYKANMCFPVNSPIAAMVCASEKDENGKFVVNAISTDGGAIPRNFTLSYGIPLVKFGAITLKELILKASYGPAKMLGIKNKGHLSVGADADIAVVDPNTGAVEMTIIRGKMCMIKGYLTNQPGMILTTERGTNHLKEKGIPFDVINLDESIYSTGR